MILIFEHGRFGNQLFQFNFCLKFLKKDEKIISQFIKDINDFIMIECEINDYTYCQRALSSLPIYLYP